MIHQQCPDINPQQAPIPAIYLQKQQQFAGFVAAEIIGQMLQRKNVDPRAMHLYNKLAANFANNNVYQYAFELCLNAVTIQGEQSGGINQGLINGVVGSILNLLTVVNSNELYQVNLAYPQNDINTAQAQLGNIETQCRMYLQQQQQMSGMNMQFQGNIGMNMSGMSSMPAQRGGFTQPVGRQTASLFSNADRFTGGADPAIIGDSERFGQRASSKIEVPKQPAFNMPQVAENAQSQVTVGGVGNYTEETPELLDGAKFVKNWKPSNASNYIPAYNPRKKELKFSVDSEGNYIPQLVAKDKAMDENAHRLNTVFGQTPTCIRPQSEQETLQTLGSAIQEIKTEVAAPEDSDKPLVHIQNKFHVETSLDGCWLIASFERMKNPEGIRPAVYRTFAQIANFIVTNKDENEFVKACSEKTSWVNLADYMRARCSEVDKEVWVVCHRKLTDTVNRILRNNLSIPSLSIDSFVDDIIDLINVMEKKFGLGIKDAFVSMAEETIQAVFVKTLAKEAEFIVSDMVDDSFEEDKKPKVTYLSSNVSLTMMDALAEELGIDFPANMAAVLTPAETPLLYNLALSLSEHLAEFNSIGSTFAHFDRHYIRTLDHRVLEITKGKLGLDHFMISLVK